MVENKETRFVPKLSYATERLIKKKQDQSRSSSRAESKLKSKELIINKLLHDSRHEIDTKIESLTHRSIKNKPISFKPSVLHSSKSTKSKEFENFKAKYMNRFNKFKKEHCKSISTLNDKAAHKIVVPKVRESRSGSRSKSKGTTVHDKLFNDSKLKQYNQYQEKYRQLFTKSKQVLTKYLSK